jgi:hypothetical protein
MNIAFFYIKEKIASTVYDHINSFQNYSCHRISYFEILGQKIQLEELDQFDIVIIHYTISIFYDGRCPAWLRLLLRNTKAKKVVFIQDEYRVINDVIDNLNYLKIDLLFTCVPNNEIEKVYPVSKLPGLKKINTLTGFVSEGLLAYSQVPYVDRPMDVVYRARKLSAWYGRLGQEKWMIAEKFSRDSAKYNLKTDISYHEKDRIYGVNWIRFLQNAKAALGCESGASVFDFTGEIQRDVESYEKKHAELLFEEIEEIFFKGLDGGIKIHQISPRCFECAALGTLMILYEGDYSGILIPWRHYVPLKKDHSNMDEIVEVLRDQNKWQEITQQAYLEVAMNPKYSYQSFIKDFDEHVRNIFHECATNAEEKNESIFFSKLEDFSAIKESCTESGGGFVRIILKILNLCPYSLRNSLEMKLRKIKSRVMLSIRALEGSLRSFDFYHVLLFWNKRFCYEYKMMSVIREYVLSVKKILSIPCVLVDILDEDSIQLSISPDVVINSNAINNSEYITKARNIKIVCANSWGIPKDIRGTELSLKYKKLVKNIVGL